MRKPLERKLDIPEAEKVCRICKILKDVSNFSPRRDTGRFHTMCKTCRKLYIKDLAKRKKKEKENANRIHV